MNRHSVEAQGYADMDLQLALPGSNQSMDVDARSLKRPRGKDLPSVDFETPGMKRSNFIPNKKRGREDEGKSARKHLRFTYTDDYDDEL